MSKHDPLAPRSPDGKGRGLLFSLVAHALLVAALAVGVNWRASNPQGMQAELWASVPTVAAPRAAAPEPPPAAEPKPVPPPKGPAKAAPPPPPPPPEPEPAPPPKKALPDPQIAIEKARREELERQREQEREFERLRKEEAIKKLAAKKLELARAEAAAKVLEAEKAAREKAVREKLAREKSEAEKLAREKAEAERLAALEKEKEKKRKEEEQRQAKLAEAREKADAKRIAEQREEAVRRMLSQAGGSTGEVGSKGTADQNAAPSDSYAGRVKARIKPNIVFVDQLTSNPEAEVLVRLASDGRIISHKLVRSSGSKEWDAAVLRAIDRTEILPRDTDGRVPSTMLITFRPRE